MIISDEALELNREEIERFYSLIVDNSHVRCVQIPRTDNSFPKWGNMWDEEEEKPKVNWKEFIEHGE